MAKKNVADLRTAVTNFAHASALALNAHFKDVHLGTAGWKVELTAPEGLSTGGGERAKQRLTLSSARGSLVIGSLDPVGRSLELRTFEHVAALHRARFQDVIDVTSHEYAEFLTQATAAAATSLAYKVTFEPFDEARSLPPPSMAPRAKRDSPVPLILAVALLVAGVVAVLFALRR